MPCTAPFFFHPPVSGHLSLVPGVSAHGSSDCILIVHVIAFPASKYFWQFWPSPGSQRELISQGGHSTQSSWTRSPLCVISHGKSQKGQSSLRTNRQFLIKHCFIRLGARFGGYSHSLFILIYLWQAPLTAWPCLKTRSTLVKWTLTKLEIYILQR